MLSENPGEKKRSLFFLTGLVFALSLVIVVLQSSTLKEKPVCTGCPTIEHTADTSRDMPVTVRLVRSEPVRKRLTNLAPDPTVDPDPIMLDIPDTRFSDNLGDSSETPVPIGMDPGLDDAEPVPPMFLEFIATPSECGDLDTKDEKMECLNDWINAYLRKNLRYPSNMSGLQLSDKVILSFVVSPSGEIIEVEVLRGQYEDLNKEAVQVLEAMPDWIPARQFTRNVPMRMVIPVYFNAR